jgi:hypothetical protein
MTSTQSIPTQATADQVAGKLQAFYDALAPEEKAVMQAVLMAAAQGSGDVQGYAKYDLTLHADVKDTFGNPVGPTNPGGSSGPVTATVGISFTIHF